jgi:hypothetical protein
MACILFTIAAPLLTAYNFGNGTRLARDSGMAFQLMFGLLIAGYAASSTLYGERKSGTMATLLSKPVGGGMFFAAKFLGVAFVVIFFSFCAALATLFAERIAVRYIPQYGFVADFKLAAIVFGIIPVACAVGAFMNYRYARSFQTMTMISVAGLLSVMALLYALFGKHWHAGNGGTLQWQIVPAAFLIMLGLLQLAALALALAARLRLATVMFLLLAFLVAGLAADYILAGDAGCLVKLVFRFIPDWGAFWPADMLADGGTVTEGYLVRTLLYSLLYTTGILCIGGAFFGRSETA